VSSRGKWDALNRRAKGRNAPRYATSRQMDYIHKLRHERGAAGLKIVMPLGCTMTQAWTIIEELKRLPKKTLYSEYLFSPEWHRIREKVLERDGHKCTKCGSTQKLHAHHETYDRVGKENIDDLLTLCRQCHLAVHGKVNKF
jgi:5-methylcytosine-specific restriction endonuclease McrA